MALCKRLKPGEYTLMPDGSAIRNINTKTIELILLSPNEAVAQKIAEQIKLTNLQKVSPNESSIK
jgi:hypothetical protein